MTVLELQKMRQTILNLLDFNDKNPLAYVLASNSIYANMESTTCIAIFDTKEMLEEYYQKSLLPEIETRKEGGREMYRFFREGSLLRNYNKNAYSIGDKYCIPAFPLLDELDRLPINPEID